MDGWSCRLVWNVWVRYVVKYDMGRIISSPIFIILVVVVLRLNGVEQRHLTSMSGKEKLFRLFCIHLSTLDIDEGINTPANGASLVHLEPSEET